ncbi:sensor histidine kinase [Desertibaculum subflavum]|uniref:sensor histidine kinase n=1 Tax=Desertibaculum subflavum TaxID=2268458 RepID=UPI0013C419E3
MPQFEPADWAAFSAIAVLGTWWLFGFRCRDLGQQLRRHIERDRLVARAVSAVLWDWEVAPDRLEWSEALEPTFGYPPGAAGGTLSWWLERVHPEDRGRVEAGLVHVVAESASWSCEYRFRRADGGYADVLDRGYVVRDKSGRAVRMIGAMLDVSELRRKDLALRESEARYRQVVEGIGEVIFKMDRDGRWTFLNAAWTRVTGWEVAASLGRAAIGYVRDADHPRLRSSFRRLIAGEAEAMEEEFQALSRNGQMKWFGMVARAMRDQAGSIVGVAGTLTDITERKQAELALRYAKEAAEAADRAKSQFLGNMSHELRTPLNAILGFAELIRDAIAGPLEERYRQYAGNIHVAGTRLLGIIDDILDLSHLDRGQLQLNEATVDIGGVIDILVGRWDLAASSAGLLLQQDVAEGLPTIRADGLRLRQALSNLVRNAIEFTPEGGKISVSAMAEATGLVIRVADSGIGIDPAHLPYVTSPFHVEEPVQSRCHQGAGLGLPLARRLIELHGGTLEIDSEPGRGTTVTLRLPRQRELASGKNAT